MNINSKKGERFKGNVFVLFFISRLGISQLPIKSFAPTSTLQNKAKVLCWLSAENY